MVLSNLRHLLLVALALTGLAAPAALPVATPASQGVDPQAVTDYFDALLALPRTDIHHVMVLRHGKVIAQMHPAPWQDPQRHTLYSCSKTFVSLAVGLAVDDGLLTVDDRVVDLLPDKTPDSISPGLAALTVRHLLTMTSGIVPDWQMRNNSVDWLRDWLAKPVMHDPGTVFGYDSMCTFVLSAIVQRVTGMTTLQWLDRRLFTPMGITGAQWEESPDGINTGGWGLRCDTEALAKTGLLLLNRGLWQGRQLVSAEWIDQATAPHVNRAPDDVTPTDGNQGYGYQVWRSRWPGAYRANGAYGQHIVVVPESDLVVVITGLSHDTADQLTALWRLLMPGVKDHALPENPALQRRLERLVTTAALPTPAGTATSVNSYRLYNRTYRLAANDLGLQWVRFANLPALDGNTVTMTLGYTDGRTQYIRMGYRRWETASDDILPPYSIAALHRQSGLSGPWTHAAAYAWTDIYHLQVVVHYTNWIERRTFTLDLANDRLVVVDATSPKQAHTPAFNVVTP